MKNNLLFDFNVDKSAKTITVKREFAAGLERVWAAWTKPEILDQWWANKGWTCTTKSMEFKEGGYRHYVLKSPKGAEFWSIMNYNNILLLEEFSGTECVPDGEDKIDRERPISKYRVIFSENNEVTLIEHTTTYQKLEDLEDGLKYGFKEGVTEAFERLDDFLNS